ncbi:hypothetical protein L226DRAFT_614738 [Lentinus tigrinus ALCF2SS1-7]|uniref:DUF6533 domain-containing protein n=1 Tax=Lentinus tigrinus ALCF2SS1-6 TaxID=1328759 RepID=A0A5C2RVD8_9APHY|nr:hypothetical protein L227DRAFT_615210 [Lentinus tigrinus ALCF2SS1-6]RPD72543.1 hypothetical protein L226DRAFT_614738 [Lentinus tigrinus ALCF2SS1-7]
MSLQSAGVAALRSSLQTSRYIEIAASVSLLYDSALTFKREVALFWSGKVTGAPVLFFTIKYTAICQTILDLITYLPSTTAKVWVRTIRLPRTYVLRIHSCNGLVKTYTALSYARYLPLAVFSAMRAYGLTQHPLGAGVIFALSLAPMAVNFAQYAQGLSGTIPPQVGQCVVSLTTTPVEAIICALPIVSRAGIVAADFLLAVITWRTLARGQTRLPLPCHRLRSLADVMLWNGLLYFVVLFALNVVHLSLSLDQILGNGAPGSVTQFTDPMTTILVARFLLDLQEAGRRDVRLDAASDDPLHFSHSTGASLSFARVVGSVGATIAPGTSQDGYSVADSECPGTPGREPGTPGNGFELGVRSDVTGKDR